MARQKRQFMRQGVGDLMDRASVDAYVGAPGEPIFDLDTLRVMDGQVPGGIPLVSRKAAGISSAKRTAADNLAVLNNEMAALNGLGGALRLPSGSYAFSAPLLQKLGVSVSGDGKAHLAYYENTSTPIGRQNGTVLLIAGQDGKAVYALEGPRYGSNRLEKLSILATGGANIEAILNSGRNMHWTFEDLELAGFGARAPLGLLIDGDLDNGSLYGRVNGVKVSNTKTALKIRDVANALSFNGGSYEGSVYCFDIDGSIYDPTGISFDATSFENTFGSDTPIQFVPGGQDVHGYPVAGDCYIAKLGRIGYCNGISYRGCYFELGGCPSTYNDGVHGTLPLVPVVSVELGAKNVDLGALAYMFLYDKGVGTRVTLPGGKRYDSTRSASIHVTKGTDQSIPAYNSSWDTLLFNGASPVRDDTRISYSSDGTFTVKEIGDYLFDAFAYFEQVNGDTTARIRVKLSDGRVLGQNSKPAINGSPLSLPCVTPLLNMAVGTTFRVEVFQGSDHPQTIQGYPDTYCMLIKN